ncbi:MAG: hypothetical protein ACRDQA_13630 [Nocardioidaceae bacterium]
MNDDRGMRLGFLLPGVALGGVGAWLLLSTGWDNVYHAAQWLVVGVIGHDFVLAPLVILLGVVAVRLLPRWTQAPVTAGFIVLGSATLFAIPVLGRFGAKADNPTLLDRPYLLGWSILAGAVIIGVIAGCVFNRRKETG